MEGYIQDILTRANVGIGTTVSGGIQYVGKCLLHDDRQPSCSYKVTDDEKLLITCHAGCDNPYKQLQEMGDIPKPKMKPSIGYKTSVAKNTMGQDMAVNYFTNRGINFDSQFYLDHHIHCGLEGATKTIYIPFSVDGVIRSYEKIHLDGEFNKISKMNEENAVLASRSLEGTNGKCFVIGYDLHCGTRIHIGEGVETCLSIYQGLESKDRVYSCGSAQNMTKIKLPGNCQEVHIWVDKDRSLTGIKSAYKLKEILVKKGINIFIHEIEKEVPEGKKGLDYNDVPEEIPKRVRLDRQNHLFEELKDIERFNKVVPKYDSDYIPKAARDFCIECSKNAGVPPYAIYFIAKTAIATCISDKYEIITPNGYREKIRRWAALVAPSGSKKSTVLKFATGFLLEINKLAIEKGKEVQAEIKVHKQRLESSNRSLKKRMDKAQEAGDKKAIEDIAKMQMRNNQELEDYERMANLKEPIISNATVQKIWTRMSIARGTYLMVRDELSSLYKMLNQDHQAMARPEFLTGYEGYENYKIERVKGDTFIENARLNLVGAIQPGALYETFKNDKGDGFLERHDFYFPEADEFRTDDYEAKIDKSVMDEFYSFCKSLYCEFQDEKIGVKMSKSASKVYIDFQKEIDEKIAELNKAGKEKLASQFNKFRTITCVNALIYRLMSKKDDSVIDLEDMQAAIYEYRFSMINIEKVHVHLMLGGNDLRTFVLNGMISAPERFTLMELIESSPELHRKDYKDIERKLHNLEKMGYVRCIGSTWIKNTSVI